MDTRERIADYQEGRVSFGDFVREVSGIKRASYAWGRRYSGTLAVYRTLWALESTGVDPLRTFGWGSMSDLKPVIGISESHTRLFEHIVDYVAEDYLEQFIDRMAGDPSLEKAFGALRDLVLGLQVATADVCRIVFGDPNCGIRNTTHISEEVLVGIRCFALTAIGYVDADKADIIFGGFFT